MNDHGHRPPLVAHLCMLGRWLRYFAPEIVGLLIGVVLAVITELLRTTW